MGNERIDDIKVSVIVPVYNGQDYVIKCLESLYMQTFKYFEVIIVDDGSTDDTYEVVNRYIEDKNNFKLLHRQNGGSGSARNIGISHAKGEYLAFVDSDDYVDKDYILDMYSCMGNSDIVVSNYSMVNENGEVILSQEIGKGGEYSGAAAIIEMLSKGNHVAMGIPCNKLIKKEYFEQYRFPEKVVYEDIVLMVKLLLCCQKVKILDKSLYSYVVRDSSRSTTPKYTSFRDYCSQMAQALAILQDNIENNIYIDMLKIKFFNDTFKYIVNEQCMKYIVNCLETDSTVNECIIWGTGKLGEEMHRVLTAAGCHVIGFVDNNINKQGQKCKGLEIVLPENIQISYGTQIIVASMYYVEICEQLLELGLWDNVYKYEKFWTDRSHI